MVYLSLQDPRPDGLCHATLALKDGHGKLVVASHKQGVKIVTELFNDASEVPPTVEGFRSLANAKGYPSEERSDGSAPALALHAKARAEPKGGDDGNEPKDDAPTPRRRK